METDKHALAKPGPPLPLHRAGLGALRALCFCRHAKIQSMSVSIFSYTTQKVTEKEGYFMALGTHLHAGGAG